MKKDYRRRACDALGGISVAPLIVSLILVSPMARAQTSTPAGNGARLSAEEQARALVARMTNAEKLEQLVNQTPAIPRLGVPAYNWLTEALHGLVSDLPTTNFPSPIGLAATFDPSIVQAMAARIGDELLWVHHQKRAAGHLGGMGTGLDVWAPNINIFRDPRWGRGQETYGEDPFLTSKMAVAYVQGIQGPDANRPRLIATPKHFAVHSGPESTRHSVNVIVSPHDLEDTYLPAFRSAIVDARAGSIMCAYNAINGTPACANPALLQNKLRKEWGFKGYVVSDCGAISDLFQPRGFVPDDASAVGIAISAGTDNECPGEFFYGQSPLRRYEQALASGKLSQADIDGALVRLFQARILTGDLSAKPARAFNGDPSAPAALAVAQRVAEKSIVLLKNDGILPLKQKGIRIALIGPLARSTRVLRGNYSSGRSPEPISVYDGLKRVIPLATIIEALPAPSYVDTDPVPVSALRTPDDRPGLLAEYFLPVQEKGVEKPTFQEVINRTRLPKYSEVPAISRIEPKVEVIGLYAQGGLPVSHRVQWTGFLVPPETGLYRLGLKGSPASLSFDEKPFAAIEQKKSGLDDLKTVSLVKGQRYAIKIVADKSAIADVRLIWKRISETPDADLGTAVAQADVVVAVVGLNADLEGEEARVPVPGFEGGDRTSLDLPADQQHMLELAKATGKPLVIVLMNGSAINLSWAKQNASAIVEGWYPGQAGGDALARVLSGAVNPAGRLPLTFDRDVTHLPAFDDYRMEGRTYRYSKTAPVYAFGFGLSYTTFAYRNLKVSSSSPGDIKVTAVVTNRGRIAGDEVAQLYLRFPATPGAPNIALRGFQRFYLRPGQTRTITFALSPRDLSSVTPDGKRRVATGAYGISVGGGQPGTGAAIVAGGFGIGSEIAISP